MVGVIGRSGAGKSTLLRMINRLIEPTSGTIRFGDTEVTALRAKALRDWRCSCAMVFQQFNLVPRLDVLTNVLMGRLNHRGQVSSLLGLFTAEERAMALDALERVDLTPVALQRAGTLSGGQQQRVAICRALQEPLLDAGRRADRQPRPGQCTRCHERPAPDQPRGRADRAGEPTPPRHRPA